MQFYPELIACEFQLISSLHNYFGMCLYLSMFSKLFHLTIDKKRVGLDCLLDMIE